MQRISQLPIYPSHLHTIGSQWEVAQICSEACINAHSFVTSWQFYCPDSTIRTIGCRNFLEPPGAIEIDQQ